LGVSVPKQLKLSDEKVSCYSYKTCQSASIRCNQSSPAVCWTSLRRSAISYRGLWVK